MPVAGGQLKEPVTIMDIRRWVQALDYPNPIHFDDEAAMRTGKGVIVAPQSFTVCCDVGHGTVPALMGLIPGSHVVFGGDEWWFYGPHILSGDKLRVTRRFDGYSLAETKFAGPCLFARGDTTYINQREDVVAKQRSTMVRYRADIARERGHYDSVAEPPDFSAEQLREFSRIKKEWSQSGRDGQGPGDLVSGQTLPTRLIGPHTAVSFAKEFTALPFTVWGSHYYDGDFKGLDAGWLPELMSDDNDPGMGVGTDEGPASGHGNIEKAKLVGMPRHFGYGSSIGAWTLDYAAYWGGDKSFIRHAKIDYRSPVFEHDVTLVNGTVKQVRHDRVLGACVAEVDVVMTNQDDTVIAKGAVTIELERL